MTDELKSLQRKMAKLYAKQKAKGAIIDVEEEGKKFLVLTTGSSGSEKSSPEEEVAKLSDATFAKTQLNSNAATFQPKVATNADKAKVEEYEDQNRNKRRTRGGRPARGHYSHRQAKYYGHARRSHNDELRARHQANECDTSAQQSIGGEVSRNEGHEQQTKKSSCQESGRVPRRGRPKKQKADGMSKGGQNNSSSSAPLPQPASSTS